MDHKQHNNHNNGISDAKQQHNNAIPVILHPPPASSSSSQLTDDVASLTIHMDDTTMNDLDSWNRWSAASGTLALAASSSPHPVAITASISTSSSIDMDNQLDATTADIAADAGMPTSPRAAFTMTAVSPPPTPIPPAYTNASATTKFPTASQQQQQQQQQHHRRAATVIEVPITVAHPSSHLLNHEEKATIWQRLYFGYIWPIISIGGKRPLTRQDLWNVRAVDESIHVCNSLTTHWNHQLTLSQPSFARAVFHFVGHIWFIMIAASVQQRTCAIVQPILLQKILIWLETPESTSGYDANEGYQWAALMFMCSLFQSMFNSHFQWHGDRQWVRIRAAVSNMVYRKSLTMSSASRKGSKARSSGEIVNIMSSDADKVGQVAQTLIGSILIPIHLAFIFWLIYDTIGVSVFPGIGSIFLVFPGVLWCIGRTLALHRRRLGLADQRVKLTNEILQGVRVVKFYAWERSFLTRVLGIREDELVVLKSLNFMGSCLFFFVSLIPLLVTITCFATYVTLGNTLTSSTTFRAVAYFNAIQSPLIQLPLSLSSFVQGLLSARRIQNMLLQPDIDVALRDTAKSTDAIPLSITNGSFQWTDTPVLKNITIHARRGQLTALVGGVGSGKSTVVSAFLGDVQCTGGDIKSCQNLGLVAQTAWIQNMSLRDNVLFGHAMDQARYDRVIEACALLPDLAAFDGGDRVEIGERGIGLSGGQKQRVAIARAVYADTDVVILDDPLSAVDANVGEHLFSKCFTGPLMGNKTRFLVTNQLHFLPRVDYIYVLKDGGIVEEGTYAAMMTANGYFADLMHVHTSSLSGESDDDSDSGSDSIIIQSAAASTATPATTVLPSITTINGLPTTTTTTTTITTSIAAPAIAASPRHTRRKSALSPRHQHHHHGRRRSSIESKTKMVAAAAAAKDKRDKRKPKKFIDNEEIPTGNASKVYRDHVARMGGWRFLIPLAFIFGIGQGGASLGSFVLSWWSEDKYHERDGWYLGIYAGMAAVASLSLLLRGFLFAVSNTRASRVYHTRLFDVVMHAPATFFDQTPVGRLLPRFTKDMATVDSQIPDTINSLVAMVSSLIGSLISVAIVTPIFLAALAFVSIIFYFVQRAYRPAVMQLQRIESVTVTPIYQGFSESLIGMSTIRAFNSGARFRRATADALNTNTQAFISTRLVFLWASSRVGVLNALLTFSAAIFIVIQKDSLDAGLAGAALSFVLSIGGYLGYMIVLFTQLDTSMNSVERIRHYTDTIPREPKWINEKANLPSDWPSQGHVEYYDAVMAYRPGLEPALKGVSVQVLPNEKVGIAGRTGSGKSTFMLSLFRMYELSSGRIMIDGININDIGVHQLRQRLAIIPQDPVIFSGTIRDNMDPFKEYSDAQIWNALEQCYLKEFVNSLPLKLTNIVSEYGNNLSVGQRQLMCMGRALLKKPKILLMDEATSSIDSATDALIQETVRKAFKDATVLTIAHRLNTIMDSDRIIVLEKGVLAEYDTPSNLLANNNSLLAVMHRAMQQQEQQSPTSSSASGVAPPVASSPSSAVASSSSHHP